MSRKDIYKDIVSFLEKIEGYNDHTKVNAFHNISKHLVQAYNIGFSTDGFVQAIKIGSRNAALKIIKLSKAEIDNPRDTSNINKLNKDALLNPTSAGINVWREVACLEKLSPQVSKMENFPYMYGFFITRWSEFMTTDSSNNGKNSTIKKYAQSREKEGKCIMILMELFDDHLLDWTHITHSTREWSLVWKQILIILTNLKEKNVIQNDAHAKNFLIKYPSSNNVPLVVLIDYGWAFSSDFNLNPTERLIYKQLYKKNRDLDIISKTFGGEYITVFQLRKLKQIQTIDKIDKFMNGLVEELRAKTKGGPSILWLKLVELIGANYDSNFKELKLLDEKKRMPPKLVEFISKIKQSESPQKLITKIPI